MSDVPFDGLEAFVAVAEAGGFAPAAKRRGVSASAISQSVRRLEANLGVALFHRTTRKVGLTEAGRKLLARCRPALSEIASALLEAQGLGERPSGVLRLSVPRLAMPMVIEKVMAPMRRRYPEITLDIALRDGFSDLIGEGFDAGLRVGKSAEPDHIATRLTPPLHSVVAATPEYFDRVPPPNSLTDLAQHDCILFRLPREGSLYQWEFNVEGEDVAVPVSGGLMLEDTGALISAARAGLGLAYLYRESVGEDLAAGRLIPCLERFTTEEPGFHLCYPSTARGLPKIAAFVEIAQETLAGGGKTS